MIFWIKLLLITFNWLGFFNILYLSNVWKHSANTEFTEAEIFSSNEQKVTSAREKVLKLIGTGKIAIIAESINSKWKNIFHTIE